MTPLTRRADELHDDLLTVRRLQNDDADVWWPGNIAGAVRAASDDYQEKHGFWPNLVDERVWREVIRPAALRYLGLEEDEVYPVTTEPYGWSLRGAA